MHHRQRIGPLRDWDDLRGNAAFTDKDFERLQPYFSFWNHSILSIYIFLVGHEPFHNQLFLCHTSLLKTSLLFNKLLIPLNYLLHFSEWYISCLRSMKCRTKKVHWNLTLQREQSIHLKTPSRLHSHECRTFPKKSPTFLRKSPTFLEKTPTFFRKRPTFLSLHRLSFLKS